MDKCCRTYDEWLKAMEEDIEKGYLCSRCGNVIDEDNIETEYAEDEICRCKNLMK